MRIRALDVLVAETEFPGRLAVGAQPFGHQLRQCRLLLGHHYCAIDTMTADLAHHSASGRIETDDSLGAGRVLLVERALAEPLGETTHWTSRAMAAVTGLAISTVPKIWRAHGLQPHRQRSFKLSRDPEFAAKLRDVVGLYVDPPAQAMVLSVDEKSHVWMAPGSQGAD